MKCGPARLKDLLLLIELKLGANTSKLPERDPLKIFSHYFSSLLPKSLPVFSLINIFLSVSPASHIFLRYLI